MYRGMTRQLLATLSPLALFIASCGPSVAGDSPPAAPAETATTFTITEVARFNEPWAMTFLPGGKEALVTEKSGQLKLWDGAQVLTVAGAPAVAYAGQGGLGDVILAPDFAKTGMVYLSWAEAGEGDTRGAAVGRAKLVRGGAPRLEGLEVIWRQTPKVTGRGHYSHRLAFSPDGKYLFVASGDRQKMTPAQDMDTNLGKVLRLLPDGKPAPGNPFADKGGVNAEIWSLGHRNILGLAFDTKGQLWDLEHGPAGGDELNLVKPAQNYGWPLVSEGDHYDGKVIPRPDTRPDLAKAALGWTPVIAPGNMIFYTGKMFADWRGQALIAGLAKNTGVVRVAIEGETAREVARHPMDKRIREIEQAPDGAIWLLEDGKDARMLRLSKPKG